MSLSMEYERINLYLNNRVYFVKVGLEVFAALQEERRERKQTTVVLF